MTFHRFDSRANQWTPIEQDKLYAPRKLPDGLRFRMWLDGREVVLKPAPARDPEKEKKKQQQAEEQEKRRAAGLPEEHEEDAEDPDQPTPQIVVLSSGDIMPFELQIERDGAQSLWRVVAQPDNDLRVERRADDSTWQVVAQTRIEPDDEDDEARRFEADTMRDAEGSEAVLQAESCRLQAVGVFALWLQPTAYSLQPRSPVPRAR